MIPFLKNNAWALIIALLTLVSTYTLYGYRIAELEAQVEENRQTIITQDKALNQLQISTARIETDVSHIREDTVYLREILTRVFPTN